MPAERELSVQFRPVKPDLDNASVGTEALFARLAGSRRSSIDRLQAAAQPIIWRPPDWEDAFF